MSDVIDCKLYENIPHADRDAFYWADWITWLCPYSRTYLHWMRNGVPEHECDTLFALYDFVKRYNHLPSPKAYPLSSFIITPSFLNPKHPEDNLARESPLAYCGAVMLHHNSTGFVDCEVFERVVSLMDTWDDQGVCRQSFAWYCFSQVRHMPLRGSVERWNALITDMLKGSGELLSTYDTNLLMR